MHAYIASAFVVQSCNNPGTAIFPHEALADIAADLRTPVCFQVQVARVNEVSARW